MRALFINPSERACGVHQYGENLYSILKASERIKWEYYSLALAPPNVAFMDFDVLLFNYQALIGGWMAQAPMPVKGWLKQCLVFHDLHTEEALWDAIFFSDPGMAAHDNWTPLGRPIPHFEPIGPKPKFRFEPVIGLHGFVGAWADRVVAKVVDEFECATIRLHLPFSKFCDPNGDQARGMAQRCRVMLSSRRDIDLNVSHEFKSQPDLLEWLWQNDLNCYMRDPNVAWRGVSSAPDAALAVKRPLAINKCSAFRHLHSVSPSICVEDSSLTEIIGNGLNPLIPLYNAWSHENIRNQVETVLYSVVNRA